MSYKWIGWNKRKRTWIDNHISFTIDCDVEPVVQWQAGSNDYMIINNVMGTKNIVDWEVN